MGFAHLPAAFLGMTTTASATANVVAKLAVVGLEQDDPDLF